MLNFVFSEKYLGIDSPSHFENDFSKNMVLLLYLLTDRTLLSDFLQLFRYWSRCVLQLFVNQVVKLQILKLTLSF